jgi:glycosyltransferase involved in cell wall biosynthesis
MLRILIIVPAPWTRELGMSRCALDLADEFRALGHHVDKFDIRDAFPRQTRVGAFFEGAMFARRAVAFVNRHGRAYDVIQAEQGNLPVSKGTLGYDGVLVCRSDGLAHFYVEWLRDRQRRGSRGTEPGGTLPGRTLRWLAARLHGGVAAVDRSFQAADVIVLLNRDEERFVADRLGHGSKAVLLPNGLSEDRFRALAAAARAPKARLRAGHVVFVGHLSERKGLADLRALVRGVRERLPDARFSLLGTGLPAERVVKLLAAQDRPHVHSVEWFASDELPALLADATAGVLPSYLEGFPLGALEQLAAGVPTIAYDAPGSRELLGLLDGGLTPAGDPAALAAHVAGVLALSEDDYAALARRSQAVAERFRWRDIARDTLAVYESARHRRQLTVRLVAEPRGLR